MDKINDKLLNFACYESGNRVDGVKEILLPWIKIDESAYADGNIEQTVENSSDLVIEFYAMNDEIFRTLLMPGTKHFDIRWTVLQKAVKSYEVSHMEVSALINAKPVGLDMGRLGHHLKYHSPACLFKVESLSVYLDGVLMMEVKVYGPGLPVDEWGMFLYGKIKTGFEEEKPPTATDESKPANLTAKPKKHKGKNKFMFCLEPDNAKRTLKVSSARTGKRVKYNKMEILCLAAALNRQIWEWKGEAQ